MSAVLALGAAFAASEAGAVSVCASSTTYVSQSATPGWFTTIQAAVQALPGSTLTGGAAASESCVVIEDNATYNEAVTVANFTMGGGSITIKAEAGMSPAVQPPSLAFAGFSITNSSVNILGINVVPAALVHYGVFVSSTYVQISSVNVIDPGGSIDTVGISLSSWTTVSDSSVTVAGTDTIGFMLPQSTMSTISYSSAAVNDTNSGAGIGLSGASSNTITSVFVVSAAGPGVVVQKKSTYNSIVDSTMTSTAAGSNGIVLNDSSSNTVTGSVMSDAAGFGAVFDSNAGYNTIDLSTMTGGAASGYGLYLHADGFNTITRSYMANPAGGAVYLDNGAVGSQISRSTMSGTGAGLAALTFNGTAAGNTVTQSLVLGQSGSALSFVAGAANNSISLSTMTNTSATDPALLFNAASSNTVTQSYIFSASQNGAALTNGSSYNSIGQSTMTAGVANSDALYIGGSSANVITQSYLTNTAGYGAYLDSNASSNTISLSTITTNNSSDPAVFFNGAATNTITQSYVGNPVGSGVALQSSVGTVISLSTIAVNNIGGQAVFFNASSSNTIARSVIMNPAGLGAMLQGGSTGNTITLSTMTGGAASFYALELLGSSSNTITASYIFNPGGVAALLNTNATFNTISLSTVASAGNLALSFNGASSNTVTQSLMTGSIGVYMINASNGNAIALSTMTGSGTSNEALYVASSSGNAVTQSYLSNPSGYGAYLDAGAIDNEISGSTMTTNVAGHGALYLNGASSNTITQSFVVNGAGFGASLNANSGYNTISLSTMSGTGAANPGLYVNSSSGNAFTQDYIVSLAGYGAWLDAGASSNTISGSTMAANNVAYTALYMISSSANVITQSFMSNPSGGAVQLYASNTNAFSQSSMAGGGGVVAFILSSAYSNKITQCALSNPGAQVVDIVNSSSNTVSGSTMTANSASFSALRINNGLQNVVTQSFMSNPLGVAAEVINSYFNTISQSTMTSAGVGLYSLWVHGASSNTFSGDYILGSTAAYVYGSTGTVIGGSALVASSLGGSGLDLTGNSFNLALSSSVVTGGALGSGVYLDGANGGVINLSTNTIQGAQYGVYALSQFLGTTVVLTSNTIVPILQFTPNNTYGIYLNGLASGATIYNNSIYYRSAAPGNNFNNSTYGLYVQGGSGFNILHNRFNNPGVLPAGGSVAPVFFGGGVQATDFKFNDIDYSCAGQNNVRGVWVSGSTITFKNNIFDFACAGSTKNDFDISANSGFNTDYNDLFTGGTLNLVYGAGTYATMAAWQLMGKDAHSISADPLFFSAAAGSEDLHPKSTVGRWNQALQNLSNIDAAQSPTIDAGDPAEGVGLEPSPNGGKANQGSFGLTAQASESLPFAYPGCAASYPVGSGQTYATITAALAAVPATPPPGKSCVVIEDSATYPEQVKIQNYTMNASSIAIFADAGFFPSVNPPLNSTAAFVIANASVSVTGINIAPTVATMYGVLISSTYVQISSVNVLDQGGKIATAGILTSSWTTVSYTSVTVGAANAAGFWLPGSTMTTVSYSSAAADTASRAALWINAASSDTVTHGVFANSGGTGVFLDANSSYDAISLSTMTSAASGGYALSLAGASSNTVSQSYIVNSAGNGLDLDVNSNYNTISQSTITGNSGGGTALFMTGAASNTITLDYIANPLGYGMFLIGGSNFNTISQSTMAGGTGVAALYMSGASSNTVTRSFMTNPAGSALELLAGSNYNTVTLSTMNANSASGDGLILNNVIMNQISQSYISSLVSTAVFMAGSPSSNTITASVLFSPQTYALYMQGGQYTTVSLSTVTGGAWLDVTAAYNLISQSTMTTDSSSAFALYFQTASSNVVTQSYISNPSGDAAVFGGGAGTTGNVISLSTVTSAAVPGGDAAIFMTGATSNTVTNSLILNFAGNAVYLNGANGNTISFSSVASNSASGIALSLVGGSSSDTVNTSYVSNPSGPAVLLLNAAYNTLSQSTFTTNSAGLGNYALTINNASYNLVSANVVSNTADTALKMTNSSNYDRLLSNVVVSNAAGVPALYIHGGSYNLVSGGSAVDLQGEGVQIDNGSNDNTLFQSTFTGGGIGNFGVVAFTASSNTIYNSYIQGSTAVYVTASTGTIVSGSVLVATNTFGSALQLDGGSVGLVLSSSVLTAPVGGAAVYLGPGNSGPLILSTNTIAGGQYSAYVGTTTPGSAVWITSNTVLPALTNVFNTYGIFLGGLASGATVQNNGVYYRTSGSMGNFGTAGIWAQNSSGLAIDHNRIDQPGMLTLGNFEGVFFSGVSNSWFKFNDVDSTGAGIASSFLLELAGNSSNIQIKNNVFFSSVSVVGAFSSSGTISVQIGSQAGLAADYNDYFSSNTLNTATCGAAAPFQLPNWTCNGAQDAHSIAAHPLWQNPAANVEDFHPMSAAGRFLLGGGGPAADGATSPTIDAGDPGEGVGLEPAPNGGLANQGSYGLTAEASESVPYPGCALSKKVGAGQAFATISAAVAALPASLPSGKSCVVIEDSSVYNEQVYVRNFTMNVSSIAIFSDAGLWPTVSPPANSTAAFVIANASVSLSGINVLLTQTVPYGVWSSSDYVSISSVSVSTVGAGNIYTADIRVSSWTTISYTTVTAWNSYGLWLDGSAQNDAVSFSTFQAKSASFYALYANGASTNAFNSVYARNPLGHGAVFDAGAAFNTISRSTMSSNHLGFAALYFNDASSNSVTQAFITNPFGDGAKFDAASNGNSIAASTMTGSGNGVPLYFTAGSSSNTVTLSQMSNITTAVQEEFGSNYNTISLSRMSNTNTAGAVLFLNVDYDTVTLSFLVNTGGPGVAMTGSNNNVISLSTVTGGGSSSTSGAISLVGSTCSSNTITQSYISNLSGNGVYLSGIASYNAISLSTMVSNSAGDALYVGGGHNSISKSFINNPAGYGVYIDLNVVFTSISQSTMTAANGSFSALEIFDASSNTITQSYIANSAGAAAVVFGGKYNAISLSTMTSGAANYGLFLSGADYGSVAQSLIVSQAGSAMGLANTLGNTISQSTMTSPAAGLYGLYLSAASSETFVNDYVSGSTAAYVTGSTWIAFGGDVLVATNTFGSALQMDLNSQNLSVSSSVLIAPAGGAGIYLAPGSSGLIVLSTNTISGARYGVFAGAASAGSQVYITSNTIVPAVTTLNSTYGLYFGGLTIGARIQNNTIAYRTSGSMGAANTSYGLFAQGSSGLTVDHNRITNPGMITGGSFVAVDLNVTPSVTFKFNDVDAFGPALKTAYLLEATGGSVSLIMKENVFSSSFTAPGVGSSSGTIVIDAASEPPFTSDYNDFFSSNALLGFQWGASGVQGFTGGTGWQAISGQDAHSISANPLWANPAAGVEDFHPLSHAGRWNQALQNLSIVDAAQSPTIDGGDLADGAGVEPAPNGGRPNQGSYGQTAEASESVPYAGCAASYLVGSGQLYATITAALAAMPASLPGGKSCIVIEDNATYNERVTVQNFTMNASSIAIFADVGLNPIVNPPGGPAAFVIANASVSVSGIGISPTNPVAYGVLVSSTYVQLSSMTILDPAGRIGTAGILTSSWTTVSYANVSLNAGSAPAFMLPGSTMTTVSYSTASSVGAAAPALWFDGASSCAFVNGAVLNSAGTAASITNASAYDTISRSTMTSGVFGHPALYVSGSASNTITQSYMGNSAGYGAQLDVNADYNTISLSTIASNAASNAALYVIGASSNVISSDYIVNPSGIGAELFNANDNAISRSSMTSGSGSVFALYLFGASSNAVTQSYISNPNFHAAYLFTGANYNTISQSTMATGVAGSFGLVLNGAVGNNISQSLMTSALGGGLDIDVGAVLNTISQSTMTGNSASDKGLYVNGAASNTITQSVITNLPGYAAFFVGGSSNNTISQSVITSNSGQDAVYFFGASSNTVTQSFMINPAGNGVELFGAADLNTISLSTMTSAHAGSFALAVDAGSSNTITQSYMYNSAGSGAMLGSVVGDVLSLSTVATSAGGFAALLMNQASSSTLTGDIVENLSAGFGAIVQQSFYNTISFSTFTSAAGGALEFVSAATNTLSGVYALGTTGVQVTGSTGTVIGGSILSGTSGAGLSVNGNSYNLSVSSSILISNANFGMGAAMSAGNGGLLVFSTNTIFGLIDNGQPAGSQLWITSNTFTPVLINGSLSYGLYLNTLTGGATVENNSIVYRSPGNLGGSTHISIYAPSGVGLMIDHNRIDEPGMISNGSYVAVEFNGATNAAFKFNDVYSTNTGLTNAYLLEALSGSTGLTAKNNVFFSSFSVSGASATISVDAASVSGFSSDYNDFFSSNAAMGFVWGPVGAQGLAGWQAALLFSGNVSDAHSITAHPLWHDPSSGVEDFHPLSSAGRWNPPTQAFVGDSALSLTIDAGDPAEGTGAETAPNGSIANQGSYGLTAEASRSVLGLPGCSLTRKVGGGQTYATIGAALAALPSSLPSGEACISIEDGATYPEVVTVQNFTMNTSSIAIFADPGSGQTPTVAPSVNTSAAFVIANASVSVMGINVVPTHTLTYGVKVSSSYVSISSVNVIDTGGRIGTAGILLASWDSVTASSVTVVAGSGILLQNSFMSSVSYSSAVAATGVALDVVSSASNTITQSFFKSTNDGVDFLSSNGNVLSLSTMTGNGFRALFLNGSSSNTISQCVVSNTSQFAALLGSGANYNTIRQSAVTGGSVNQALYLSGASNNSISQVVVVNSVGTAAQIDTAGNSNSISLSTITSPVTAVFILDSSSNALSGDYVQGSTGVYVQGSTGTVIGGSRLAATGASGSALQMDGGSAGLQLSSSVLTAPASGAAVYLAGGDSGLIVLATNTLSGAQYGVFAAAAVPGTQIWITSNTIVPATTGANNTYGLYLGALTAGATVENNTVAYRTPGSVAPGTSFGFFALNSSGLVVDHNRFDEPGMITGGSYVSAKFSGGSALLFKFNDVFSTGTAFTNAFLFESFGTSGLTMADNVFSSSFVVSNASATIFVDAASQATFAADYNDYFSSNAALGFQWGAAGQQGLAAWQAISGKDAHSIAIHPHWFNPSAGAEDFHPLSQVGRFSGGGFTADSFTSGLIDAADPAESVTQEPPPNGGRANLGSYGGTAEASESPAAPAPWTSGVFASSIAVSFTSIGSNGFVVTASTAPNFTGTLFSSSTANGASTALAPQGLTPDTTYFLQTGAIWGDAVALSPTILSSATLAFAPGVAAPTFSVFTNSSLVVNWTTGGNPVGVATYTVVVTTGPVYPNNDAGNGATSTTVMAAAIGALSPNTTYFAFAAAQNWAGVLTSFTPLGSTSTLANAPLTAVSTFTDVDSSSMTVLWSANGNPLSITTYTVQLSTASDFNAFATSVTFSTAPAAGPAATFTGLAPFTTYYFRVAVIPNNGTPMSVVLGSTQTTAQQLPAPALAGFFAINSSSIAPTWGLVSGATGYTLAASLFPANPPAAIIASSAPVGVTATTATLVGLAPNTTYFLFVQATGPGAAGPYAAYAATSTLAAVPLTAVSTFSSVALTSFTVTWVANGNALSITTYTVQASTASDFNAFAASVTFSTVPVAGPSASFGGLTSNSTWYVRVRAINNNGVPTAYTVLGSTYTLYDATPPTIVDSQAGDDVWRAANLGLYNVKFADATGTHLVKFQVKASTTQAGLGNDLVPLTDVLVGLSPLDAYNTPWALPASVFNSLLEGVTNYISVKVFNGLGNSAFLQDAFYVKKDTTAPAIANNQLGDGVVRSVPGTTYAVSVQDGASGLAAFQYSASLTPGSGDAALIPWTDVAVLTNTTFYQTPWALSASSFAVLGSGSTNYISVRSWDVAGTTRTAVDAFYILKDTAGPSVSISSPTNGSFAAGLPQIVGTASSLFPIKGTEVSVQLNPPGGAYWNPASSLFNSVSQIFMPATGTNAWTLSAGIVVADGSTYQAVARSSTTFNQYSTTYATSTFVVDTATPTVGVVAPVPNSTVAAIPLISGTALDPGGAASGLSAVEVRLRRNTDGLWWNWFTANWGAVAVSTVATGTTNWVVAPTQLLQANLANGTSYFIAVRASDNASPPNQGDFFVQGATFTWQDVTPPATISDLAAVSGAASASINLTWTTPGDDGASGLLLTGQYRVFYSTDSTDVASTMTAQVVLSTALAVPGAPMAATLTGLTPAATYFVRVALADSDGNWSAFSNQASTIATPAPFNAISGHVVDLSTSGITGVQVDCWDAAGNPAGTTFTLADGSGTFSLNGLSPGNYKLRVTWTVNGVSSSLTQDNIAMGSFGVDFVLEINYALATLTGTLGAMTAASSGGGGYGIAAVHGAAAFGSSRIELNQGGRQVARVSVLSNGRWTIPHLLPGTYTVRAFTGLTYTAYQTVTLSEGDIVTLDFAEDPLPNVSVFAFPNPARTSTTIRFQTALQPLQADVTIFDIAGNLVREIPGDQLTTPDNLTYYAKWDLTNSSGQNVASGVYLMMVKVKGGSGAQMGKVIKKIAVVR